MTDDPRPSTEIKSQTTYQIRIKGHLGPQRMHWFEGMTVTLEEDGNTLLMGTVVDQSALHGILKKIRDMGMPLLLVKLVQPDQNIKTDSEQAKDNV